MIIQVTSGKGSGPTTLAAFDSALLDAGVANYNLIKLSSIVPPNVKVVETKRRKLRLPGGWGDRLYVVMADAREDIHNTEAWAAVGWAQDEKTGKGLFAEHIGAYKATVQQNVVDSIIAFAKNRRMKIGPVRMKIEGIKCGKESVCALVVAVFGSDDWKKIEVV